MRLCKRVCVGLGVGAVVTFLSVALLVVGCEKGAEERAGGAGQPDEAVFANVRCPIMGTPIEPAKVPDNLVRTYKGQKVAFCCAGCPAKWDKLSDAEKDAKLAAVRAAEPAHQEHDGGHAESHEHESGH